MGLEQESPLLMGLSAEEASDLLAIAEQRSYETDVLIVGEGTTSDCLFILDDGAVRVEKQDGANSVLLATIDQRGDFFGEMSLIDILPRSANIHAARDSRILAFPKRELTGNE